MCLSEIGLVYNRCKQRISADKGKAITCPSSHERAQYNGAYLNRTFVFT